MQKLQNILMITMLLAMVSTGCKKFVDVTPPANSINTEQVFLTDKQAAASMAGIYSQMMSGSGTQTWSNGNVTLYAGLSADEISSYQLTATPPSMTGFENGQLSPFDGAADAAFWSPVYKLVGNINFIIDGVNASKTLSDSARKVLLGEAKFIRAFSFFYLTNFFGDIPLPLTADFTKINLLSRASRADVYKQIIQDLIDAQQALPDNYSRGNSERIYPCKAAATALLARAYLYIKDWKNADAQATAVIGNGQFSLLSDLTKVFLKNSVESIWQLQPNTNVGNTYGPYDVKNFVPTAIWSKTVPPGDTSYFANFSSVSFFFVPNYYLYKTMGNAFERGDKRKTQWTSYTPTPHYAPYNGDTIFYPMKYPSNPRHAGDSSTQYYMVLRVAEQYLIRAEAKAYEGDVAGSAADINIIRARAGLAPTSAADQASLLTAIMHERQVELFAEWGHRFFDLKRTGLANAVIGAMPIKQPWNSNQLLYPISTHELQVDPNLTQTPGY